MILIFLQFFLHTYKQSFSFFRFEKRTQEAAKLKVDVEKAQETITSAETLVGKLQGEFKRWSSQVKTCS